MALMREKRRKTSFFYKQKDKDLEYFPYLCPECEFPFKFLGNLQEHIKSFHMNGVIPCNHCEKKCSNIDELKLHIREHFDEHSSCPYCETPLGLLPFDFHLFQCEKRPQFDYEKAKVLTKDDDTRDHYKLEGTFKILSSHTEISNLCWITKANAISEVSCFKCLAKFSSQQDLAAHKCSVNTELKSRETYSPYQKIVPANTRVVSSPGFQSRTQTQNKFSSPHLLCKFIDSQNPNSFNRESKCPLCSEHIFQNAIIAHLLEKHEMSYENVICVYTALNKKFSRIVLCKWCKREFKKSSSCTAHARCCHRKPNFATGNCSQCNIKFENIEKFQIHNCVREYKIENAQCKYCNISLNNLLTFDFKNHEEICHPEVNIQVAQPTVRVPAQPIKRGRKPKPFSCTKCKLRFEQNYMLDNHMLECCPETAFGNNEMDFDVMKFCCQNCGQCFSSSTLLANHPCDDGANDFNIESNLSESSANLSSAIDPLTNATDKEVLGIKIKEEPEDVVSFPDSLETQDYTSDNIKFHIVDFNYQEVETFNAFVPINQSHFICSICYNNLATLNLLAEHLVTKHSVTLPPSLKIGQMKSSFGCAENESIL